jgi:hypothetical protein
MQLRIRDGFVAPDEGDDKARYTIEHDFVGMTCYQGVTMYDNHLAILGVSFPFFHLAILGVSLPFFTFLHLWHIGGTSSFLHLWYRSWSSVSL